MFITVSGGEILVLLSADEKSGMVSVKNKMRCTKNESCFREKE